MSFTSFILKRIKSLEWSEAQNLSDEARQAYERGIDLVDGYRGHPELLLQAIDQFHAAQSKPYAYAGWAYTLMAAAYISGGRKYNMDGLREAQGWLHEATKLINGRPEIHFIQLMLFLNLKQYDAYLESRNIIDSNMCKSHFHMQFAHLDYYLTNKSLPKAEVQFEKTIALAKTTNQQQLAYRRMTQHFVFAVSAFKILGEKGTISIAENMQTKIVVKQWAGRGDYYFSQMSENAQDDPWFWHNYSLLHYHSGNYWKAAKFNKKALSLMLFGAAQKTQAQLKKKLSILYHLA